MLTGLRGSSTELAVISVLALWFWLLRHPDFLEGFKQGLKEYRKTADQEGAALGESLSAEYGRIAGEALTLENNTAEIPLRFNSRKAAKIPQSILFIAIAFVLILIFATGL
jgi:hypothetical protein